MLVRQMYQSLHSRKFLGSMWLLLLAALLTYVVIFLGTDAGEPSGGTMFSVFGVLFYLVALLVLPYMAFSNLREEVLTDTIELIQITRLDARRQTRGRLQAALSRLLLLYSVIGPFAVVAFLFGGIALGAILLTLYSFLVFSCVAVSMGLFFAGLTAVRYLSSIARWLYFAVLLGTLIFGGPGLLEVLDEVARGHGMDGWEGALIYVVVVGVIGTLVSWFLCAATANMLTFEANKSAGRTKFILLLLILSGVALFFFGGVIAGFEEEALITVEVLSSVALAFCAMFWLTGDRRLPARLVDKLRERGFLRRLVHYPFADGAGPTTAFLVLVAAVIAGGVLAGITLGGVRYDDDIMGVPVILAFAYAPYFSSQVWGLGRLLPASFRTAGMRRGILLGLLIVHAFIAILWFAVAMGSGLPDTTVAKPLSALFPLIYFGVIDDMSHWGELLGLSLVLAIGILPHFVVSVRDLVRHLRGDFPGTMTR